MSDQSTEPDLKTSTPPGGEIDLSTFRTHFPSLALEQNGQPVVYLDNPGGTQVPQFCIDAITAYLSASNANTDGAFVTSRSTNALLAEAHASTADFLGASDPREIVFGPNMTTLTFALSRAIGRTLTVGDEIVITALDHDANASPWQALAEERGAVIRVAEIDPGTCTLDMADLHSKITERTMVVAVGYASNAVGTINDVPTIVEWARDAGAISFIDAVHFAPHGPIDVEALGCDFLVCSAYKFFAPHLGILYGRLPLLERLASYKVRPAPNEPPGKWEMGTQNHECLAGLAATLDYLAELGSHYTERFGSQLVGMVGQKLELHAAMLAIAEYERRLVARLLAGLRDLPGAHIYGLTAEEDLRRRVPTVMLTVDGYTPRELAESLSDRGIFCWDGNYYALNLMERLNLEPGGGALRIGLAHYNTVDEVDRVLAALGDIVSKSTSAAPAIG
jgi:cysteine desulfurase family protein (TIGR01976 family)